MLDPGARSIRHVYEMLRVLHVRGYERLRVVPGMSPSGMHYRVSITHAGNVRADNGARAATNEFVAHHSSASGTQLFGWTDAPGADASKLADLFIDRFPAIAQHGFGADRAYVDWFLTFVLPAAEAGAFPLAYADYDLDDEGGRYLATTKGIRLPLPP